MLTLSAAMPAWVSVSSTEGPLPPFSQGLWILNRLSDSCGIGSQPGSDWQFPDS